MKVFVLAYINSYDDGIPCYGSIYHFSDRQKAIDWLTKEYADENTTIEDLIITAEDRARGEPTGWEIWEDEIM